MSNKSHACPFTHPQIQRKFPSSESKKLCNDYTEAPAAGGSDSSGGDDDFTIAQPVPMA